MEQNQLPLGFSMALAQHPKAMERFSRFTASEKETVLAHARQASSSEKHWALFLAHRRNRLNAQAKGISRLFSIYGLINRFLL